MIKIFGLKKFYGKKLALDIDNITIKDKTFTSIIGPNGSGKSTLLSILANNIQPSSGYIEINKLDIKDYTKADFAKTLSILHQSNDLDTDITVKELVSFGRYPYSKGKLTETDKYYINDAIRALDITHIQNKSLLSISGGEKQRALIAMLLAQNTQYILLDEPLNNLDMRVSKDLMIILKTLIQDYQKTIIAVIHDINFASIYSDQILCLKNGSMLNYDTPGNIITKENLEELYGINTKIIKIDDKILCNYF